MEIEVTTVTTINVDKALGERSQQAKRILANEIIRNADPYVPFKTGFLKNSAIVVGEGDAIQYSGPYARYQWYGKLMVDPITKKGAFFSEDYGFWSRPNTQKELTDRDLHYNDSTGLRGPFWVERMWADKGKAICSGIERMFENNGNISNG